MAESFGKTREASKSIMSELVLPNDTNLIGNLLGGRLLHWIDIAGALAASKHANGLVATVTMDTIEFKHPIRVGNIVTLFSYVTWTGKTSIEVAVEVHAEDTFSGAVTFINRTYLVFISIDKLGDKRPTVPLICSNEAEEAEFQSGFARKERRIAASNGFA